MKMDYDNIKTQVSITKYDDMDDNAKDYHQPRVSMTKYDHGNDQPLRACIAPIAASESPGKTCKLTCFLA